jgi:hypothetical protein
MPELPRYRILRTGDGVSPDAGALFDLPRHGQVGLHTDDAELVLLLESTGLIEPRRPPYLDAADRGIHGAYRSRPQVNTFLEPPIERVADAFARAFADAGGAYAIEPAARLEPAADSAPSGP